VSTYRYRGFEFRNVHDQESRGKVKVYVEKGDRVSTKQEIGKIYTDPDDSKTELHFELWKAKSLLDSLPWLAKKR